MDRKRNITIVTHLLIWAVYILLPLLAGPRFQRTLIFEEMFKGFYVFSIISSIGFYYFNYAFALPKYYAVKKYLPYIVSVLLFVIVSVILMNMISSAFPEDFRFRPGGKPLGVGREFRQVGALVLRLLFIFIASFGFYIHKRLKQIEVEKVNSELLALKSQINPHFLFNILNDIYGQAITKSDKTADNILKLSSIMRYVITETPSEYVLLEKEVKYLENYIELQKARLTDKTKVSFQVIGGIEGKEIPPLLFISFIENAFKYGVSTEVATTIDIKIEVKEQHIVFTALNGKPTINMEHVKSSKIGIANTIKRLDLLFGGNYKLEIENHENTFKVCLRIDLK